MTAAALAAFLALGTSALDARSLFASADVDGDGAVTRAEFLAARDARFDRLDRDRDKRLTPSELAAAASDTRARTAVQVGFRRFDRDGDGGLDRDELRRGPTPAFDRADRDGDGRVTAAELPKARP